MPTLILLKHYGGGINLCQFDQGRHMLCAIINRGQKLTCTCTCSMIKFSPITLGGETDKNFLVVKFSIYMYTVFPRNLAAARFYFKAPFGAVTIRGRLDFEGGVYRDRYARSYTASIISLVVCT